MMWFSVYLCKEAYVRIIKLLIFSANKVSYLRITNVGPWGVLVLC